MNELNDTYGIIKQNKFFKGLNDAQLKKIQSLIHEVKFKKNNFIMNEGDLPDVFYIIQKGTVEITKQDPDNNISYHISTLSEGAIIGEIGLVSLKKRTASIRALTDVDAFFLKINDFRESESSELFLLLMRNISEDLVDRLDESYNLVVETLQTELKKSKKLRLYQWITIIIIMFFLIGVGMAFYYVLSGSGLCSDVYKSHQKYPDQTLPAQI